MRAIQIELANHGCRLLRNNVGVLQDKNGQHVRYGLAVGSADLIGWSPQKFRTSFGEIIVAVFTAIEVKRPGKKATPEQLNFIHAVQEAGGIAGVASSVEEALKIVKDQI